MKNYNLTLKLRVLDDNNYTADLNFKRILE